MDKIDRRIQRTNRLLQEALIELTLERGYDAVTIRDITDKADVGYATFFRHYPDKDALLVDLVQAMKEDFMALLAPHWLGSEPEKGSTILFQYVEDNFELVSVLLNSSSTMALLEPAQEIGLEGVKDAFTLEVNGSIPVEVAANHLVASLISMMRWWVEHNMPYTPEQMGRFTTELIIRPVMTSMSPR
ncbi:MAG: TetR/AcrR family transcriptional regulator [Chloroflexota bacterium]